MKKVLVTILALLIMLSPLLAEEESTTASYTLEDIEKSMKEDNASLRKAREVYNQSLLDVKDAKANYQPQIEALLTSTFMPNPPIGKTTISVDELSSQLGVTIPGAVSGEYVTLYKGMKNTYYNAGLTITQPIYTWGKIPTAVDLYTEISNIRALSVQDSEEKLSAELKTRLSALCYMNELFDILDDTQAKANELVSMSEDGYKNGMLLKEDVTKAKISALEVSVKRQELVKQYNDNLQALKSISALDDLDADNISYTVNEEEIKYIASLSEDEINTLVLGPKNKSLNMLRSQTKALELKKKVASSDLYWKPDLALQVSLNYGGPSLPLMEANWYRTNSHGVYLTFAVKTTVWDGGKKLNAVKHAESEIQASYADYDDAVNQLKSATEENLTQIELSNIKLEYLGLKLDEAQERLNLLNTQYEQGLISKTQVLSQEIELNTVKGSIVQEKIDLSKAVYTICYLAGIDD